MRCLALIFLMLVFAAGPAVAQTPQPTPTSPSFTIPSEGISEGLQEADDLQGITDITAPDGAQLLPDNQLVVIMGYAKWLLSTNVANEFAGPFGPIVEHLGYLFVMQLTMGAIYFLIYAIIYAVKWAVWIFFVVTRVLEFAAGLISKIVKIFI